jgi:hypothetical protein
VKLWLDPNITIIHYGVQGYPGNYHEHLMSEKAKADAAAGVSPVVSPETGDTSTTGSNVVALEPSPSTVDEPADVVIVDVVDEPVPAPEIVQELKDISATLDEEAA